MVAVRGLSTSDAVSKSVINNTLNNFLLVGCLLPTYRPPPGTPGTRNMTAGSWISVSVNLILNVTSQRKISNFVPRKPILRDLSCNRNESKQSVNTGWQITEVSNSAKPKFEIPKTERQM